MSGCPAAAGQTNATLLIASMPPAHAFTCGQASAGRMQRCAASTYAQRLHVRISGRSCQPVPAYCAVCTYMRAAQCSAARRSKHICHAASMRRPTFAQEGHGCKESEVEQSSRGDKTTKRGHGQRAECVQTPRAPNNHHQSTRPCAEQSSERQSHYTIRGPSLLSSPSQQ